VDSATTLGLASIAATVVLAVLFRWLDRRHRFVFKWRRVLSGVRKLRDQIRLAGFEPALILTFPGGGLIVADLLVQRWNRETPICSLSTKRLEEHGARAVQLDGSLLRTGSLRGRKVLVVDDVLQTGATISKTIGFLVSDCGVKRDDIRVAVLAKPRSPTVLRPDFAVFEIDYSTNRPRLPWGEVPVD